MQGKTPDWDWVQLTVLDAAVLLEKQTVLEET